MESGGLPEVCPRLQPPASPLLLRLPGPEPRQAAQRAPEPEPEQRAALQREGTSQLVGGESNFPEGPEPSLLENPPHERTLQTTPEIDPDDALFENALVALGYGSDQSWGERSERSYTPQAGVGGGPQGVTNPHGPQPNPPGVLGAGRAFGSRGGFSSPRSIGIQGGILLPLVENIEEASSARPQPLQAGHHDPPPHTHLGRGQ